VTSLHSIASCHDCAWEADGPNADQMAHLHTTSKARGHTQHATTSRTHPTTRCAQEGCHD
jgi:hypothetical protein